MTDPCHIVDALDLREELDLAALSARRMSYDCVHLGMLGVEIGRVLDVLAPGQNGTWLCPPRTGHLGNWEEIASGRAGALDFNQTVCVNDYGYPLIYCFTQTEAWTRGEGADPGLAGDWVYMPGSVVKAGERRELPLYAWDGVGFARRGRDRPLFCPFVLTEDDEEGGLVSLTEYHLRRMRRIPGFRFRLEPQIIVDNEPEVREILGILLEEAARQPNNRRAFQDLISHAARTDGILMRCELRCEGGRYWLLDQEYPSAEALIDQLLNICRVVSAPKEQFAQIRNLPRALPVMSTKLAGLLSAILGTHLPDCGPVRRKALLQPVNLHVHWGARDMAGYPPRHKGYYVEKATTRSLRAMCTSLTAHLPHVSPVCVLLLPAAVFLLCPSSAHPRDLDAVAELLRELRTLERDVPASERATLAWLKRWRDELSSYFLHRFRHRSGIPHAGELSRQRPAARSIVLDEFRNVTMLQACAAVGALVGAISAQ